MTEEVFYDAVEDSDWLQGSGEAGDQPGAIHPASAYELHRAAFYNDTKRLAVVLQHMPQEQHKELDLHGNTALHVAAMRGHKEAVELLLEAGVPANTRSSRGWTAFDEACAAQAMACARVLRLRVLADAKADMKAKRAQLLTSMRELPDYSLQLKWQLGSSLPGLGMLLRRYAPHDTYTVWKVGDKLRVDGSLMGIDTSSSMVPEWKRGHFSLIVDGSPEGIAAAAAAAAQATAAACEAARRTQQPQPADVDGGGDSLSGAAGGRPPGAPAGSGGSSDNRSPSPAAAPATPTPAGAAAAVIAAAAPAAPGAPGGTTHSSSARPASNSGHDQQQQWQGQQQQQQQQQQQADAAGSPPVGGGGPRLLFLNHAKGSWVDLSADKKALKAEAEAEAASELNSELVAAMQRDIDKLRLKPRNFKFAPVKGWLGGDTTEKVEGWKCAVYEATGKLLAVSTSKSRLVLPAGAAFADYLAAEYAADEVSETLIDPLSLHGMDVLSSSGKKQRHGGGGGGEQQWPEGGGELMGGGDAEFDSLVWGGEQPAKQQAAAGKQRPRKAPGAAAGGDGAAGGGGRLLRARCWMAQDFPMSLAQLLPLLDVMGAANKHMAKVGSFLSKYSRMDMFPVKLQVPLLLTVHVLLSFKAFHPLRAGTAHAPPGDAFFAVPASYRRRLLADVMDKAASKMALAEVNEEEGDGDDDDSELWGSGGGGGRLGGRRSGGPFFGGDEGAEYMQIKAAAGRRT